MKKAFFAHCVVISFLCTVAGAFQTGTGKIMGRVVERESLKPLAAEIGIAGRNQRGLFLRHTIVSEAGLFEIGDLPSGNLHLTTKLSGYASEHLNVVLNGGENRYVEFYLTKSKTVRGVIYNPTQGPVANARVSVAYAVEAAGGGSVAATYQWEKGEAVTDGLGKFELKDVHPEREFVIEASHPDFPSVASAPVRFRPVDTELSVNLSFSNGIGVAGVVKDGNGNIVRDARVKLLDERRSGPPGFILSEGSREGNRQALSQMNGAFSFDRVRPVKKVLLVLHPAYAPFRQAIDLTGRVSPLSIEVRLQNRGSQ